MSLHWGGRGPGHKSRWPKAAVTYDPATTSLIARMTTPPDATRAGLINAAILSLKAAGLWSKLEVLRFFAAADSQAALLNWISTSYNATLIGSPTFTADRGFAGNGTTTGLDSNWNPSTSTLFTQNSASIGAWLNAGTTTGSDTVYCLGVNQGGNGVFLGPRNASDGIQGRVNQATSVSYAGASSTTRLGFCALSRTGAAITKAYKNASAGTTSTTASSGRPNANVFLGGLNTAGSITNGVDNRFAMDYVASGLSDAEELDLYNIANTYLTAVGGN